jgi:hypothetical protein
MLIIAIQNSNNAKNTNIWNKHLNIKIVPNTKLDWKW